MALMKKSTVKSYAITSIVFAAVSLIIGGTLLDIIGTVFGAIAWTQGLKIAEAENKPTGDNPNGTVDPELASHIKLAKIGVAACVIAFALNLLAAMFLLPWAYEQLGLTTSTGVATSGAGTSGSGIF